MRLIDTIAANRREYSKKLIYSLSFLLPFAAVLLLFILNSIAPFGDRTLLVSDAYSQYSAFWSYYRDILAGKQDAFYSLEKTLGGSMAGLFAYYLASPFNVIFALFPKTLLPVALHLTVLLKLSLCGLTAAVYFKNTTRLGLSIPLLSTAYALCAYNVSFCWCVMWLDCVMLLPPVALGLRRIADGKRPWLYILSLGGAIFCSYYIGFMLCIFSLFFFAYTLAVKWEKKSDINFKPLRTFALSSLTAGGLSAVILVPGVLSMSGGKRESMGVILHEYFARYVSMAVDRFFPGAASRVDALADMVIVLIFFAAAVFVGGVIYVLVSEKVGAKLKIGALCLCGILFVAYNFIRDNHILFKLYSGTTDSRQMMSGSPNIFTGILLTAFALTFFFNKKISRREKIVSALFAAVLLISFCSLSINMIWHGFTENHSFNYRYSFIFSFLIIILSARSLEHITHLELRHYLICGGILGAGGLVAIVLNPGYISAPAVLLDIALLAAPLFLFTGHFRSRKHSRALAFCLGLLHILNLLVSANITLSSVTDEFDHTASDFASAVVRASEMTDALPETDSPYRVRKDFSYVNENDPMLLGYNGISHYSSTEKTAVIDFAHSLGAHAYQNIWTTVDYGFTGAGDSLLGVKYFVGSEASVPGYTPVGNGVFENPFALPVGFISPAPPAEDISVEAQSPFEYINDCYKTLFTSDSDVFSPADMSPATLTNMTQAEDDPLGQSVYEKADPSLEGRIDYSINVTSADPMYLYITGEARQAARIFINGEQLCKYFGNYSWRAVLVGRYEPGSTITLSIVTDDPQLCFDEVHVAYEHPQALQQYSDLVSSQQCRILSDTDSRFIAEAASDRECSLVLTIPYDDGWQALVDGEKADTRTALGVLMCVDLSAGEHTVELRYIPKGLIPGAIVTALSLGILLTVMILDRRKKDTLDHFFN